jgi:ribosomal protein S18 acetylase RimI-like enzyme
MKVNIRKSEQNDLNFLEELEKGSFPEFQQSTRRAIRYSITSPLQKVIIAETQNGKGKKPVGSATFYLYAKTLRIFSIAVLPEYQGQGIGRQLLDHAMNLARSRKISRISLEARKSDQKLVQFYQNAGFRITEELPDYYMKGEHGQRMALLLDENIDKQSISNIIIVRNPKTWYLDIEGVKVVSSRKYITGPEYQSLKNVRIFNLSNSYQYQKMGYYVSLLASARDHRVIPNVTTLRDFSSQSLVRSLSGYIDEDIQKTLKPVEGTKVSIYVYFGKSVNPKFRQLAQKLYHMFEAPLLQIDFVKTEKWMIQRVTPLSLKKLTPTTRTKSRILPATISQKNGLQGPGSRTSSTTLQFWSIPRKKIRLPVPKRCKTLRKLLRKKVFILNL